MPSERYKRWNEMLKTIPKEFHGTAKHILFVYLCDASPIDIWLRLAERAMLRAQQKPSVRNKKIKTDFKQYPERFLFQDEEDDF